MPAPAASSTGSSGPSSGPCSLLPRRPCSPSVWWVRVAQESRRRGIKAAGAQKSAPVHPQVPFTYVDYDSNARLWPAVRQAHEMVDRYQLVNSYGLFRRMTGVGGRPEVVMEGSHDGVTWTVRGAASALLNPAILSFFGVSCVTSPFVSVCFGGFLLQEIEFMYKPGNVSAPPPVVTPHQPRLDWQMWFAALGSHTQAPWFTSLVYRLLQGKQDGRPTAHLSIRRAGTEALLWGFFSDPADPDRREPLSVSSAAAHLPSSPPLQILVYSGQGGRVGVHALSSLVRGFGIQTPLLDLVFVCSSYPQRWWRRVYDVEFYPSVHLGHSFLESMLNQYGLKAGFPFTGISSKSLFLSTLLIVSPCVGQVAPAAHVRHACCSGRQVGALPGERSARPHAGVDPRRRQRHRLPAAAAAEPKKKLQREPKEAWRAADGRGGGERGRWGGRGGAGGGGGGW